MSKEAFTPAQIVFALDKVIEKISKELDRLRDGHVPEKPKHTLITDDIWNDIQEERYEHLENFMMSLKFIREHPDKEMSI